MDLMNLMEKNNFVERRTSSGLNIKGTCLLKNIWASRFPNVIHLKCEAIHSQSPWPSTRDSFLIQPHDTFTFSAKICWFAKSFNALPVFGALIYLAATFVMSCRFKAVILVSSYPLTGDLTIFHNISKVEKWRSLQPSHVVTSQTLNFNGTLPTLTHYLTIFCVRCKPKTATLSFHFFPFHPDLFSFKTCEGLEFQKLLAIIRMLPSAANKRIFTTVSCTLSERLDSELEFSYISILMLIVFLLLTY